MDGSLRFDYYYGLEPEQFSFYRVPRMLMKDERFKGLSSDAKLLYGMMQDRLSLSQQNGWVDEQNRPYIYYTMDNIMNDLGCGREKCAKLLAELDSKKGIGLIEKKRQGLGKPDIIYVKNFIPVEVNEPVEKKESPCHIKESSEVRKSNFKKSENRISRNSETELQEVRKSNFKKSENRTTGNSGIELAEVRESNTNYNNNNYTELNYNNPIYLSKGREDKCNDAMDDVNAYIEIIKENVEYEYYMKSGNYLDKGLFEELFELICEVVCVKRRSIKIGGEDYPYELVKAKFLKLNSSHIEYVIGCMKKNTSKIANIKAYMITTLYNAPSTINHYYQQEVQHDLYGGGFYETNDM